MRINLNYTESELMYENFYTQIKGISVFAVKQFVLSINNYKTSAH